MIETNSQKKIFFVHIPKCAGTAIRKLLEKTYGRDSLVGVYDVVAHQNKREYIESGKVIYGHFGTEYYRDYSGPKFTVTVLRDPVDRLVSHYSYWKSANLEGVGPEFAKRLTFLDFLKVDVPVIRQQISNLQAWMLISDYRMKHRFKYSLYSRETLAEFALEQLEMFDFVGVTESLSAGLPVLAHLVENATELKANKNSLKLQRLNQTKNRIDISELTDEELDVIHHLTDLDRIVYKEAKAKFESLVGCLGNV